nr:meteorin isoform X1 [Manis javanica]
MGRPPASGSSGYPPTPAPAGGSADCAPSTTREGVGTRGGGSECGALCGRPAGRRLVLPPPRAPLLLAESSGAAPRLAAARPTASSSSPAPAGLRSPGVGAEGAARGRSPGLPAPARHAAPRAALGALRWPLGRGRPRRLLGGPLPLERQATPHPDISRRVASFRFELREDLRPELPLQAHGLGADGACRPCSDAELLLAACTSDFVIHGTIHGVAHDMELQESVITVAADRVLRQSLPLFWVGGSGGQVQASIHTPLQCGVRPGPGTFLFMAWSHFGEAWLGCAPRFQEFSRAYMAAHADRLHPCEVALD